MQHDRGKRTLGLMILYCTLFVCATTLAAEKKSGDENIQLHAAVPSDDVLNQIICMEPSAQFASANAVLALPGQVVPTEPVPMSCTAQATCQFGQTIQCTGCPANRAHAACPNGTQGWVSCGGVKTWCPACCIPDPSCTGRPCSTNNDCGNGSNCPQGFCAPLGICMCES